MEYLENGKIVVDSKDELFDIITEGKIDLSLIDIKKSGLTDLSNLFSFKDEINGDISKWDTSDVTNMEFMFSYSGINPDISKWNTSNVINMGFMFSNSKNFDCNLNDWDFSSVISVVGMFLIAENFNNGGFDLTYNLYSCRYCGRMFAGNKSLDVNIFTMDFNSNAVYIEFIECESNEDYFKKYSLDKDVNSYRNLKRYIGISNTSKVGK